MNKKQVLILELAKEIYVLDLLSYYNFNNVNKNDHKLICFGASDIATKFIELFHFLKIDYIVDNDIKKSIGNSMIFEPSILSKLDPSKTIIFNCTSNPAAVKKQLQELNFNEYKHNLNASLLLYSPFLIRIYLESNIKFLKDLSNTLSQFKSKYIFTDYLGIYDKRKFPNYINSIITDNAGLQNLAEYVKTFNLLERKRNKIPIDIIVNKLNHPNFIDVYPKKLINDAYNSIYKKDNLGIKILNDNYKKIIFHYKSLFFPSSLIRENQKYFTKENNNEKIMNVQNLISDKEAIEVLNKCKYKLPLDKARNQELHLRLRGIKKTILQKHLSPKRIYANKELIVFIIRKCLIEFNLLNDLKSLIRNYDLIFCAESFFDNDTKTIMQENIRGGNWDSTELEKRSGPPVGLISYIDPKPNLNSLKSSDFHPYRSTEIYNQKSKIRKKLSKLISNNNSLNFIHSPDDEREAYEYIELLNNKEKRKHIVTLDLY